MRRPIPDETERTTSKRGMGGVRVASALCLVIEADRPLSGGARYSLEGIQEVRIGRGNERSAKKEGGVLSIEVPDRRMSGDHARMTLKDGRWTLEDPGSTNGTFVEGERVRSVEIKPRQTMELGHT